MVVDVVDSFGGDGGNLEQFHRGGGGGYYYKRIGLSAALRERERGETEREGTTSKDVISDRSRISKRRERRVFKNDRRRRRRVFGYIPSCEGLEIWVFGLVNFVLVNR